MTECYSCSTTWSEADITIACTLCEHLFHAKCAKLSARERDLIGNNANISWTCSQCFVASVEMIRTLKVTRGLFLKMAKDLAAMQDKLLSYEKLFFSNKLLDFVPAEAANRTPVKALPSLNLPLSSSCLEVVVDDGGLSFQSTAVLAPMLVPQVTTSAAAKASRGSKPPTHPTTPKIRWTLPLQRHVICRLVYFGELEVVGAIRIYIFIEAH